MACFYIFLLVIHPCKKRWLPLTGDLLARALSSYEVGRTSWDKKTTRTHPRKRVPWCSFSNLLCRCKVNWDWCHWTQASRNLDKHKLLMSSFFEPHTLLSWNSSLSWLHDVPHVLNEHVLVPHHITSWPNTVVMAPLQRQWLWYMHKATHSIPLKRYKLFCIPWLNSQDRYAWAKSSKPF